jgi:hypothetical protein
MAYRVSIAELGVANDNTVIEGATPGDVWRQVQKHLKDKHKINVPDIDDLGDRGMVFPAGTNLNNSVTSAGQPPIAATGGRVDTGESAETAMIVTRLVEKLHLGQQSSGSSDTVPPGGSQAPMP